MTDAQQLAIWQLKHDEGFRQTLYADNRGFAVGYGHNMTTRGLNERQADWLLTDVVEELSDSFSRLPWFRGLNETRQGILLEMAYQMGVSGVLNFKRMIAAIERGNYEAAADEMLDSEWARRDTPKRAERAALRFRRGY